MNVRQFRLRPLSLAVAALVATSGLSTDKVYAASPVINQDNGIAIVQISKSSVFIGNKIPQSQTGRYIVRYAELPVPLQLENQANGNPSSQSASAFQPTGALGRVHLDASSSKAKAYVQELQTAQANHLNTISTLLGRTPNVVRSFKFALNAVVLDGLSAADLSKLVALSKQPGSGIVSVQPDYIRHADTDIGPGFIGASSIWWGSPAGQDTLFANGFETGQGYRGDGVVIGDIDTGYNSLSPSFAAIDDHGYQIQNPLGSGNFIGDCGIADISLAGCNDKVIGVYDELSGSNPGEPARSAEDSVLDGHGSHTGSTAGGNSRSATISNYTAELSGVAPHANLVIYRGLYNDSGTTVALAAAADQAIQDGIVDAVNYSISGGTDPWNDPVSLAFLSATDSGIFVAAAAGNTSTSVPVALPGTANHLEPWVTSAAASTHTGGPLVNSLDVVGPIPTPTVSLFATFAGTNYSGFTTAIPDSPLVLSPNFHNSDLTGTDGCSATTDGGTGYAGGTFTGSVAVISRGTCAYGDKVLSAQNAGAVAVVVSDNRVEDVTQLTFTLDDTANSFTPTITIPVFFVAQADGSSLQSYLTTNTGISANIPTDSRRYPVQPDVLASFSLLGPTKFSVIKPDIQAPGVNILAAVANDPDLQGPDSVAFYNGTSMATPHTTGTGALLMGLHPGWTPMEVKSAIMMTAKEDGLTKPDGSTPSDYFDRGAGRVQAYIASKSGLVMNETGLNFLNADPATGGDPSTLNLASMQSDSCLTVGEGATCSFQRRFHSTQDHAVNYAITFAGEIGPYSSASTSSLVAPAHSNAQPLTIDIDLSAVSSDGKYHFGEMVLTPSDATLPTLHLPMAIKVPLPSIATAPKPLSIAIPSVDASATGTLTVSNTGGPILNVTNTNDTTAGAVTSVVIDQVSQGNYGFYANFWDDQSGGSYVADDFNVYAAGTNLTKMSFPGFVLAGGNLTSTSNKSKPIHFEIYSDAGGTPNGNPETVTPSYVWHYVSSVNTSGGGISVTGNTISLNLATATGITPTNLTAGRYWVVVYFEPAIIGTGTYANGWLWFESTAANGYNAQNISPVVFGVSNWTDNTAGGDFSGMAMHIEQVVTCGAPWLSTAPGTLSIGGLGSAPLTVTADSTQFPVGSTTADAYLCLDSNDAAKPIFATPIHATGGTGAAAPPTVAKAFSPSSVMTGSSSNVTITLNNPSAAAATLSADLVDTMPTGLVATTGSASTTCTGGTGASVAGDGSSVTLATGAQIPGAGSCAVTFASSSSTVGSYTNTIAAGDLQTDKGTNANAAADTLTVSATPPMTHTVTSSVGTPSGSVDPLGDVQINEGDTTQFTLTADSGYHVDTVGGTCNGTLDSGTNVFTTNAVTADCTVIANFAADAAAGKIVISQVYGAGGNSGAPLDHDYIELFNSSASAVDISNWSVQYTSGTGTNWSKAVITSGTIQPGKYFLIQTSGGTNGSALPTPDLDAGSVIQMAATGGKLALTNDGSTTLTGNCPTGTAIKDFVGFKTGADCFEGSGIAPPPSTTTAIFRGDGGCTDTDDNTADFSAAAPAPRNSSTAAHSCGPTHTVTPSVGTDVASGTISPDTQQTVSEGDTTSFTLASATGYHVDTVAGTCPAGSLDTGTSVYTTGAIVADCSVIANFAVDVVTVPPTLTASFAPNTHVATGSPSTLILTLNNPDASASTLVAALTDSFPTGLVVAATPNASTTCTTGSVTANAGDPSFNLASGAQIGATGSCTVTVNVQSATAGVYVDTLPAGSLQTTSGNNANPAAANLVVAGTFPAPYCTKSFGLAVQPITSVVFAGINKTSSATVDGTPDQEDFLSVTPGTVGQNGVYAITVQANTAGPYADSVSVYFDWNHDGEFNEDASERYDVGAIINSTGTDSTSATSSVAVPASALSGLTRMRVVHDYGDAVDISACDATFAGSYGQTEDYLVTVDPNVTLPPLVAKSFSPDFVSAGAGGLSTLTITLTSTNATDLATTADFTDTFPSGLVVAPTPNASTTCASGSVTANAGDGAVTLVSGALIPGGGTCNVQVDVTTATGAIYVNTIPGGALQLAGTNSESAASAEVQFAGATPTYATGFETSDGFATGDIDTQQDWYASTASYWNVATSNAKSGSQQLRATATTNGTGTTFALKPAIPVGTAPYSVASGDFAITVVSTGETFDFLPQDNDAGFVNTSVRFLKGAGNHIQVLDASDSAYHDSGATWTGGGAYQHVDVVVDRSSLSMAVCLDGTQIYTGLAFAANISSVAIRATQGTGTKNNILDSDNVSVENAGTVTCMPPATPTPPSGPVVSSAQSVSVSALSATGSRQSR